MANLILSLTFNVKNNKQLVIDSWSHLLRCQTLSLLKLEKKFFYSLCLIMTVLASAVMTKYHRQGGLNNRHVFVTVLVAGESQVKVPAWLGSGEGSLPGLQMATFLLCLHRVEREWFLSFLFFSKDTNPIMRFLPSWPLKGPSPNTFTLEFKVSTSEFWGQHHSFHSNDTLRNEINSTFENFPCFIGLFLIIAQYILLTCVSTGPTTYRNRF